MQLLPSPCKTMEYPVVIVEQVQERYSVSEPTLQYMYWYRLNLLEWLKWHSQELFYCVEDSYDLYDLMHLHDRIKTVEKNELRVGKEAEALFFEILKRQIDSDLD